MGTRNLGAKRKTSDRSSFSVVTNNLIRLPLSSRLPKLLPVVVPISPLLPSNLPPAALRQYNQLTIKELKRDLSERDPYDENKKLAVSPPKCTISPLNHFQSSLKPVSNHIMLSHLSEEQSTDKDKYLFVPDSPISVEEIFGEKTETKEVEWPIELNKVTAMPLKCNIVLTAVDIPMKKSYQNEVKELRPVDSPIKTSYQGEEKEKEVESESSIEESPYLVRDLSRSLTSYQNEEEDEEVIPVDSPMKTSYQNEEEDSEVESESSMEDLPYSVTDLSHSLTSYQNEEKDKEVISVDSPVNTSYQNEEDNEVESESSIEDSPYSLRDLSHSPTSYQNEEKDEEVISVDSSINASYQNEEEDNEVESESSIADSPYSVTDLSQSVIFQTPDKLQLHKSKTGNQRWIKSVNLEISPLIKQRLSIRNRTSTEEASDSSLPPTSLEVNDENATSCYAHQPSDASNLVDADSRSLEKTCKSANSSNAVLPSPLQSNSLGIHSESRPMEQSLISTNAPISPILQKPPSICISKSSHHQLDSKTSKVNSSPQSGIKARRNIMLDVDEDHVSSKCASGESHQSQQNMMESASITATCSKHEVSDCKKWLKSVAIERLMSPTCEKQLSKLNYAQDSTDSDKGNVGSVYSNRNDDTFPQKTGFGLSKNSFHGNQMKLELINIKDKLLTGKKILKTNIKRKRTLSWNHRPYLTTTQKRARTLSLCLPSDMEEFNSQSPFVVDKKTEAPKTGTVSVYHSVHSDGLGNNKSSLILTTGQKDTSHHSMPQQGQSDRLSNKNADSLPALKSNYPMYKIDHDHTYSAKPANIPYNKKKAFNAGSYIKPKENKVSRPKHQKRREKQYKKKKALSIQALQKKYKLSVPLKELVVNCERLIPDNHNVIKIRETENKKRKRKKYVRKPKLKCNVKQREKYTIPRHYKSLKPDQIRTVKRIDMRYRVAFNLWPQKYASALDKINQRINNQNMFWKTLDNQN